MTVCILIIEYCGMKSRNCGTKKKFSYFTVIGIVMIRLPEKGTYSIITHTDDFKEIFLDEDFSMFLIRLFSFVLMHIVDLYLDS